MAPETQTKQKIESKPTVESTAEGEPQKKSGKRWILIAGIALVVLGGLAFGAFSYFRGSGSSGSGDEIHAAGKELAKATMALEPFLVNLADTEESRFVKTTFQLGLAEELKEEGKDPIATAAMRDSIITLLSSKTSEQILTSEGKEKLRGEIRTRVNAIAPELKVLEVYIVDFVVQL
jgi:flagellar FliL protein